MDKLFIVFFLLLSLPIYAQKSNDKQIDLDFQPKVINFGTVHNDTVLTAKFVLKNISKNKIDINYVNPECSCTDYYVSKYVLNSNDTASIILTVNTAGKFGKQKIYTIVNYGEKEAMKKLTIKCDVYEK